MEFIILFVVALVVAISCVRIVPQAEAYVVERMGKYLTTWDTGVHFAVPFIDRVARKVRLKEQVVDFPPSAVITKDNVTVKVDSVTFFQVTDPKLFCYGIERPIEGLAHLTATTLRNIFGNMELDESLSSRDTINNRITAILDEATDKWGIKVNRVELKTIEPPKDIQEAMEKQMRAERERREQILQAEGHREASIKIAQGKKEAAILEAEAEKAAAVLRAQAEKEAAILRAEAIKEARIREAEGEAEALRLVKEAEAAGIKILNAANPSEEVLKLRGFEALEELGNGNATKIIVPSEIQSLAGLVTSVKEISKGHE